MTISEIRDLGRRTREIPTHNSGLIDFEKADSMIEKYKANDKFEIWVAPTSGSNDIGGIKCISRLIIDCSNHLSDLSSLLFGIGKDIHNQMMIRKNELCKYVENGGLVVLEDLDQLQDAALSGLLELTATDNYEFTNSLDDSEVKLEVHPDFKIIGIIYGK